MSKQCPYAAPLEIPEFPGGDGTIESIASAMAERKFLATYGPIVRASLGDGSSAVFISDADLVAPLAKVEVRGEVARTIIEGAVGGTETLISVDESVRRRTKSGLLRITNGVFEQTVDGIRRATDQTVQQIWEKVGSPIAFQRMMARLCFMVTAEAFLGRSFNVDDRELDAHVDAAEAFVRSRALGVVHDPAGAARLCERLIDDAIERPRPNGNFIAQLLKAGYSKERTRQETYLALLAMMLDTAMIMTWASYELSKHGEVVRRIREEARRMAGTAALSAEHVGRMRYTKMCVEETMRLYPVAAVARAAPPCATLGNYAIPARANFFVVPSEVGRNPKHWPDPEAFVPERFADRSDKSRGPGRAYTHTPFGFGATNCTGARFTMNQVVLYLASLCRRVDLEPLPGYPIVLEPYLAWWTRYKNDLLLVPSRAA